MPLQTLSHVLVALFPHRGEGQAVRQVFKSRNLSVLQLRQLVDVPEQVAQVASQGLHILLSSRSAYSFVLVQEVAQVLVSKITTRGLGQAITQVDPNKYLGGPQDKQEVAAPEQVRQIGSQVLQILLSSRSGYSLELVHFKEQALVALLPTKGIGHALTQVEELRKDGKAQLRH